MISVFSSTGQMCFAGSRLLVQESIHDEFVARLAERVKTNRPDPALWKTPDQQG